MKGIIDTLWLGLQIDFAKKDLRKYCKKLQKNGNKFMSLEEIELMHKKVSNLRDMIRTMLLEGDLKGEIRKEYNESRISCEGLLEILEGKVKV